MRKMLILACGAMAFGLAGGYAWSALTAPAARAPAPRKAATVALPQSPEERPVVLDQLWASRADDEPVAAPAPDRSVHYSGCNEVRAAGKAPLHAGEPGYSETMDGDGDGIACEPHRGH
jgi:hypothetical protein